MPGHSYVSRDGESNESDGGGVFVEGAGEAESENEQEVHVGGVYGGDGKARGCEKVCVCEKFRTRNVKRVVCAKPSANPSA